MASRRISPWLDGIRSAAPTAIQGDNFTRSSLCVERETEQAQGDFKARGSSRTSSGSQSFYSISAGSLNRADEMAHDGRIPGKLDCTDCAFPMPPSHIRWNTLHPNQSVSCAGQRVPRHDLVQSGSPSPKLRPPELPEVALGSSNRERLPLAEYVPPSYDVEMISIKSVALDKLPHSLRPEPLNRSVAWLHAASGLLVVFNCWGIGNIFGLFQNYYETIYLVGARPSTISWIGSTQLALVFGLGVPVGRLVDRGHFRFLFHSGSLIMVAGLFGTSWCNELWTLWLVQGLLTGAGMGMVFCSGMVAMMTWFDERHVATAMGLAAAGSCLGGIVYVLIARHCLLVLGFAVTMRVLGGVAAVTMIPANVVFRVRGERSKQRRKSLSTPKTMQSTTPAKKSTTQALFHPAYMLAAAGMFFAMLGVYFGFVYIIAYASQVLHLSNTAATNLLVFMLAANLPGRFLPALISDRCIGPLNTLVPSLLLSSAVIWLWAAGATSQASLTVIACFYGFVSAGVQVLYAPAVYAFCVDDEPVHADRIAPIDQGRTERIGTKAGGIFTCIGLACLIGTPIGGALVSYRKDRGMAQPFLGAQMFAGSSLLLAAALLLASRVAKAGWTATKI